VIGDRQAAEAASDDGDIEVGHGGSTG
jgi:hypothetical protein